MTPAQHRALGRFLANGGRGVPSRLSVQRPIAQILIDKGYLEVAADNIRFDLRYSVLCLTDKGREAAVSPPTDNV